MDTSRLRSMSHCKVFEQRLRSVCHRLLEELTSHPGLGSCPRALRSHFASIFFCLWSFYSPVCHHLSHTGGVVADYLHKLAKGGRGESAMGLTMEELTQTASNEAQFSCRNLRGNVFNP